MLLSVRTHTKKMKVKLVWKNLKEIEVKIEPKASNNAGQWTMSGQK